MILQLWLSLLALSIVVALLGYFTDEEPYLTVGLTFLFLLSIVIVTGNLEYQTGATYTSSTITYTYTTWSDSTSHWTGYLLGALSGIGIALSLRNIRQRRRAASGAVEE